MCVCACVYEHTCILTAMYHGMYSVRDIKRQSFSIIAESYLLLEWGVNLNVELKIFPDKD